MTTHPLGRVARRLTVIGAVGAVGAGLLVVASAPPAAADSVSLTGVAANGMIGVTQSLVITAAVDGAPCGSVQPTPVTVTATNSGTQTLGQATFANCVGSAAQYTFQWSPQSTGVSYIAATIGTATSNAVRTSIAPVPTVTRITSANTAQIGVPTPVTASVTAINNAQFSPQGTIQFSVVGGGNIGGPIPLNNAIPSTVQIQWTPAVLGGQQLVATYTPANAGTPSANTTCGASCTSAPDSVQVTQTGVKMFLSDPPGFNVGETAVLTAVVSVVPPSGAVTFLINGSVIAAGVPVGSNGQAQARWVPPAPGQYTIQARWAGNGGLTASSQEIANVGTAPAQPDIITLGPVGQGAWSPAGVYTLANGTSVTFQASTASGSPVTLSEPGPCTLSGMTMTATQGSGQCRLTATSVGGRGYAKTSVVYTINLAPGTQTPVAPVRASGRVNRGSTVTLVPANQNRTNAGVQMSWRVTSGGRSCQLRFPANGAVRLHAARNGDCNVRAIAAAVPGQWNRMVLNRTYRVR